VPGMRRIPGHHSEQIRVRSRSDEVQILAIDLVDQQPIRFDVAVAKMPPVAAERVVLASRRQRTALHQQQDDRAQLRHVLAALLREFHIALELRAIDRVSQGLDSQILEQRVGRLLAFTLALVGGAHGLHRGRVRNPHIEGQGLLGDHADEQHADGIGHRHAHRSQRLGGPLLRFLINAYVNHRGRHN